MNAQAGQYRVAGVPGDKLAAVGLLAIVKVGIDGVLQQMDRRSSRP